MTRPNSVKELKSLQILTAANDSMSDTNITIKKRFTLSDVLKTTKRFTVSNKYYRMDNRFMICNKPHDFKKILGGY